MAKRNAAPVPLELPPPSSPLQFSISVLAGAIVAMMVLLFLRFGVEQLFAPFSKTGGQIYRALAMSGLAAGVGTVALSRQLDGPQAAMSASLGWGIWGLSLHFKAPASFFNQLAPGVTDPLARTIFYLNAPSQALCVAFGLLIAAAVGWFFDRAFRRDRSAPLERKIASVGLFRAAMSYPLIIGAVGGAALMLLGALALPLGEAPPRALPSGVGAALFCDLLAALAMAVGGYIARRFFQTLGTAGYVVAPPLVIAFVAALWVQTQGEMTILQPAALLIWRSSPFEIASWGAFGSTLGYFFARNASEPNESLHRPTNARLRPRRRRRIRHSLDCVDGKRGASRRGVSGSQVCAAERKENRDFVREGQ